MSYTRFVAQRNERAELARAVMDLLDQGHRGISRHLDLTRMRILGTVAARGPLRPGTIAAGLGLTASATSRHLTALERAGRIAVEPDPADQRTFLARVTESGQAELDSAVEAGSAAFAEVVAGWPDEDIVTARRLITRLTEAWAGRGEPPAPRPEPGWRRARRTEEE
jgi:DNA-binding MarR family transcriptional regulator